MATVISKIGIKDSTGSGYDTRDLGAKCQNVEVGYDASGNVISDVDKTTPTTTKALSTTLQILDNNVITLNKEKAPCDHKWSDNDTGVDYGKADSTHYGHIKPGNGLYVDSDSSSSTYGATNVNFANDGESSANKAVQSNDARLSDARKNPNAITFTTDSGNAAGSYDGSAAKTVGYGTVGAAPAGHTTTTASSTVLGHVKVGTGLSESSGTLSVSYGSTAGTACQGNDSRLSDSRTPTSHAATTTAYGGGNASSYGHVKLDDAYTSVKSQETAAYSVAASAYALQSAYSTLNNAISTVSSSLSQISGSSQWKTKYLTASSDKAYIYFAFPYNAGNPTIWQKAFGLVVGINNVSGCILEYASGFVNSDKTIRCHSKSMSTTTPNWSTTLGTAFNFHVGPFNSASEILVLYHGPISVGLFYA
jgi:hypothetical protein